jgi:RHS repeat-associated protein
VRHYPSAADADAGTNLARTVSYGFDASGNVTETADTDLDPVDPAIETTVYDELDRPELVTVHYVPGGDRTLESSYDRYGNRKGLVFTDGADVMNHAWTYDKLNRLKEAQLASPSPLEFTYFANDDLETITHGNGVVTEYAYWPEGPVQSITVDSPSEQLLKLTYTVNKVLNITGMNEQHAASGAVHGYGYGYDALDRLTSATYPTALGLPASESFAYDAAGNREDPSNAALYDYDANNRITASPGKAWVYDGDGNPVSVNAGTGTEETFAHDAQNRMRGYTNAATSASASYLHDPFARRMKKSVNGTATWFVWDGDQLLAQFDGSGDRDRRYAYTGGFAPAEQAVVAGSGEDVQAVHADHLDTPRGLSGGSADAVWRAAYRAFGSTTPDEDPDGDLANVAFAVRFPGQLADPESSLHYNVYRRYDSRLGRYLEADPLGQHGGTNVFHYGSNNSVNRFDHLGLEDSSTPGFRVFTPHEPKTLPLQQALALVRATKCGKEIEAALKAANMSVDIILNDVGKNNWEAGMSDIFIDPKPVCVETTDGCKDIPLAVRIVHEAGHGLGVLDVGPGRMKNVNQFENPFRDELGLPRRTKYEPCQCPAE